MKLVIPKARPVGNLRQWARSRGGDGLLLIGRMLIVGIAIHMALAEQNAAICKRLPEIIELPFDDLPCRFVLCDEADRNNIVDNRQMDFDRP